MLHWQGGTLKQGNKIMINPTRRTKFTRLDQLAECYDVSLPLYKKIWNDLIPTIKTEKNEYHRIVSLSPDEVFDFWNDFTDKEKIEINFLLADFES